jgi:hypothetical protein
VLALQLPWDFSGKEPPSNNTYKDTVMKTKAILAASLVTLALLAGCNKEKESTSTTTTTSDTTTSAPAPAEAPATTKTQESTTTTTETEKK